MRCVAIVQARMTSTRLPGKVLSDLAGKPMLSQELARLKRAQRISRIVVATTTNRTDDPVAELAEREAVGCFRGDEEDVLNRYFGAATEAQAEVVVRITADCPLIDPDVIDQVVAQLTDSDDPCDYASNTIERTYPRGLDVEAFHYDVLARMHRMARSRPAREHVTYFLHRERPELFDIRQVKHSGDHSCLRWTVDTHEDLALLRAIYAAMQSPPIPLGLDGLLDLANRHPEWSAFNAHVEQKQG